VAPVVTLYYHITTAGISLLRKSDEAKDEEDWENYVADIHPWNYWNQAIATRSSGVQTTDGDWQM